MRETVAIIGGGVAGLTAAHELIQRGFEVTVFDRRPCFGGKAASRRHSGDVDGLPGEHGFRFFPGWYRHLTDTMSRIPYHQPTGGRRSVADNLVSVNSNLLAWFNRPPVPLPLGLPRKATDFGVLSQFIAEFGSQGLDPKEIALFFTKLIEFVMIPDSRRVEKFEGITWWQFLECEEAGRSNAYKDLVRATTRTMVAAKAEEVSAYSIGRIAVRTLLETLSSFDRVLNGPTSEVWIEPWIAFLRSRGVVFESDMELQSIQFHAERRKVRSVVVEALPVTNARRLRRLLTDWTRGDQTVPDEAINLALQLIEELGATMKAAEAVKPRVAHHTMAEAVGELSKLAAGPVASGAMPACQALADKLAAFEAEPGSLHEVDADYFVLALPLEQLAYFVNRTTMLTFLAPEFRNLVRLARHMDWMSGIQFYLQSPLDISPGHLVGLDSTWALTAIEQTQFWKDVILPTGVRAILSVDISAWDRRGRKIRKEAFNCTDEEIAAEVWAELKEMLNKQNRVDVLRDEMLVGEKLARNVSYHLDESVVDLRDRKKQAFYERARSVRFNTLDMIGDEGADDDQRAEFQDAYMWGPRLRFNAEPLLINRSGSRALRPEAVTSIPNLFLAGDFIRTETDLASMEGANEAARLAVNGILDATGSREERCQLWPFSPSREIVSGLMQMSGALRGVGSAAAAASRVQDRFWKSLATGLMKIQGRSRPDA